jgi:DNA-binding PadR family transcriptional regulator
MTPDTPVQLTPAMFHILLGLADRPRHGLGIVHEVEQRTAGDVKLGPGLLYGSIKKLSQLGLIEDWAERPDPNEDDPRRRYYRITERGLAAVRAESERLARILRIAADKRILTRTALP